MIRMRKPTCWFVLLLLIAAGCHVVKAEAPAFTWKTSVKSGKNAGFYKIPLIPEVSGRMKPGYRDVRLYNPDGKEIPYTLREGKGPDSVTVLKGFRLIKQERDSGCCSNLVFRNISGNNIQNIFMEVYNADVSKTLKVKGSNNREDWFVVQDKMHFNPVKHSGVQGRRDIKHIPLDLPVSSYTYFKLIIGDSLTDPVNVKRIGYKEKAFRPGQYFEFSVQEVQQKDSAEVEKSYAQLIFDQPYFINRLSLKIATERYHRRARIYKIQGDSIRKPLKRVLLDSRQSNPIELNGVQTHVLEFVIDNGDSPPLKITGAKAEQQKVYLVSELQSGTKYTLRYGNEQMGFPEYDLRHFESRIPDDLPVLKPDKPERIPKKAQKHTTTPLLSDSRWIWIALIMVIGLLGYLTYRMLQGMGKPDA